MSWEERWQQPLDASLCPACDRRFLSPAGTVPARCPLCFQAELEPLAVDAPSSSELLPYTAPPELVLPFAVSEARFAEQVSAFARSIPFSPADLTPQNLRQRAQRLYLPRWLVDADVEAAFQAEVGFDYQVVSHRERYAGGSWHTEKVEEGRVRWEPRAGRLRRHYPNLAAPALEAEATWQQQLGPYAPAQAAPYEAGAQAGTTVVLPDRSPADAWPEAIPPLRQAAQGESRRAAQAGHIRDFRWAPRYGERNWTQFLRPLYATFYRDDEGNVRPVFLNGQSGQIGGSRRASMQRARRLSFLLGGAAALVMVVALLLGVGALFLETALLTPAALGFGLAFLLLLGVLVPPALVWNFNRRR